MIVAAARRVRSPDSLNQLVGLRATSSSRSTRSSSRPRRRKRRRMDGLDPSASTSSSPARVPRHRDGAVRRRRAHRQRVGAARGHRARRDRPPRSRRLVRRPARDPARLSVQALARRCSWPEEHSASRDAGASSCSTRPASCTGSTTTTASCSSTRRCCTTSASTSRTRATTGTPRTSSRTVGSAASTPEEILVLTALVRWHRRGEPKASDDLVGRARRRPARPRRRLAALLRIADGLDRSRKQVVDRVAGRSARRSCSLRLQHPAAIPSSSCGARGASASCSRRSSTASSSSPPTPRLTRWRSPRSRSRR